MWTRSLLLTNPLSSGYVSRISSPRLNISFSFGSLEFITDERGKNQQKDRDLAHIKQN